jgi:dihydrosphingosine 1-phosphate phosphatase
MPGSRLETAYDGFVFLVVVVFKIVSGVSTVFAFRLVLKPTLQKILPPTFRFLATVFTLPRRRWYTPATEYEKVPDEHVLNRRRLGMGASVPSVIDLSTTFSSGLEVDAASTNIGIYRISTIEGLTRRRAEILGDADEVSVESETETLLKSEHSEDRVRHYDADGKLIILYLL